MWDRLRKNDQRFGILDNDGRIIPLTSYAAADLPPLSKPLTAVGRFMVRNSPFARILAHRVGKEEVTFYSLLGQPEGAGIGRVLDRRFLKTGGPPLNWRRNKVVQFVRESLSESLDRGTSQITFWDIGSGAGFDSLDVARQLCRLESLGHSLPSYRLINVDVDKVWLRHNEELACALLPKNAQARFRRRNASIFDYLDSARFRDDLSQTEDLIITCNGFADFFALDELRRLLAGIQQATLLASGHVRMVFPMALKNPWQQMLSALVGFDYRARSRRVFEDLLAECIAGMAVSAEVRHSQVVFVLRRTPLSRAGIAP
ncbi:MAG TPA: hypothetical protein DCY13_18175 [Verrucomicrobiales bacterium]|nr:hypothetical protein [Verrucomicrobiales bacterium]